MHPLDSFRKCFEGISVLELNQRIGFFKNLIQRRSSHTEQDLRKEVRKVFASKVDGKELSFFLNEDIITYPNQLFHFYKIRKFKDGDYNGLNTGCFPSMNSEQDGWWVPPDCVQKYGRLNRPGESILYVSKELTNAIYETGCKVGDCFFVMVYRSRKRMRISQIHPVPYLNELTEVENAKRILMHNFLLDEFTKLVPKGREFEYMSTLLIYEEYYKNKEMDAFSYPSIASICYKGGFNMAFPIHKAKENLSLVGVMVSQLGEGNPSCSFTIRPFWDGFWENGSEFKFYPYNSTTARKKLAKFTFIRDTGL